MQLSLTYYSLGVTISFCKFWFENDTLIQVRLHDKIYVDIYLKILGCILVLYTHQI